MYNKLFSRILYSSIWTESYATRLVWIAMLAAMDEDGIVHAATPRNLAALAGVTPEEAEVAVTTLSSPDSASSNPDHEGRRIERFPGGWVILNAPIYRTLARRDDMRHKTAERVRRHRERLSSNGSVTGSETEAEARSEKRSRSSRRDDHVRASKPTTPKRPTQTPDQHRGTFDLFWSRYPLKVAKQSAWKAWSALKPESALVETIVQALDAQRRTDAWTRDGGKYIPHAATWLRGRRWEDVVEAPAPAATGTDPVRQRTVDLVAARLALLHGPRGGDQ